MTVEFDLLQELTESLISQGGHFQLAVKAPQWVIPALPGILPSSSASSPWICVQIQDYNVILVRTELISSRLRWSNPQSGTYRNQTYFNSPLGLIPLPRAWETIDVEFDGKPFRFVGTDLDAGDPSIRQLQGAELRSGLADTVLPVVIAMDSNAQAAPFPKDATYLDFVTAGYADAWLSMVDFVTSYTCCQQESNDNVNSQLYQRIDLILTSDTVRPSGAQLYGDKAVDKTQHGLWPSDHAGIAAQIALQ